MYACGICVGTFGCDAILGIALVEIPFKEGMAESALEVLTGTMKGGALMEFVSA